MIKFFKTNFLRFLKISVFMILLICPIVILGSIYPQVFRNTQRFLLENTLFLIGIRWSLILTLTLTWQIWIYKIANKYQWSGAKRRFWLAQRFRITGWLIVFELLICENILAVLIK
jgi:hypothetical protein